MKSLDQISKSWVCFAPMVGISHFAVRNALARVNAPKRAMFYTEMLSSRRLPSQKEGQKIETIFRDRDEVLVAQLLGNDEGFIRDSVKKLEGWGACAIDINMGCPVKQALAHNYGVALMGDAEYAARVAEMATRVATVPVSVKLRAGLQEDLQFLIRFAKGLEGAGVSWITVHPRLAGEGRRGVPRWEWIKRLKKELQIPIIGNGDLECFSDIQKAFDDTGCDRVMIGRALLAKPWLLQFARETTQVEPSMDERSVRLRDFWLGVIQNAEEFYPEPEGLRRFRFMIYHARAWLEYGEYFFAKLIKIQSYVELREWTEAFFKQTQKIYDHTLLRQ